MIFLWILCVLLLLLFFLLFVPIHVIFRYQSKASVTVRILFLRFDGMKLFRKLTENSDSVEKDKAEQSKSISPKKPSAGKTKADPFGFVQFLIRISRVITLALKEHFKRMTVSLKSLYVSIGTDDAAKTALYYGGAIQAANALCVLLQRFSRFKYDNRKLVIAPDFTCEKSRFSIHLDLTMRLFFIIGVLLRAYFRLFERKEMNYERDSVETSH